jgi:hypothetical protein
MGEHIPEWGTDVCGRTAQPVPREGVASTALFVCGVVASRSNL